MKLYQAKAVAELLGVTERRVRQLRDEGIIKEKRPGLYSLVDTNHRYINFLKGKYHTEGGLDYYQERAKLIKTKRQSEELDLRKKKGELHESSEIEEVMTEMLLRFKTRMESIPAKLSNRAAKTKDPAAIYKMMQEAIIEALEELSDFQTAFEIEPEEEDEHADGNQKKRKTKNQEGDL